MSLSFVTRKSTSHLSLPLRLMGRKLKMSSNELKITEKNTEKQLNEMPFDWGGCDTSMKLIFVRFIFSTYYILIWQKLSQINIGQRKARNRSNNLKKNTNIKYTMFFDKQDLPHFKIFLVSRTFKLYCRVIPANNPTTPIFATI